MVVINNKFAAILATAGALSTMSSLPNVAEAAAIQTHPSSNSLVSSASHGDLSAMDQPPSVQQRQHVLALPKAVMANSGSTSASPSKASMGKNAEKRLSDVDPTNSMTRLAMRILGSGSSRRPTDGLFFAIHPLISLHAKKQVAPPSPSSSSAPVSEHYYDPDHHANVTNEGSDDQIIFDRRHDHNKVVVKGDHDRVKIDDEHHHSREHNKVIVKGDHDRVHIGRHVHYDKIVVEGDNDKVRVNDKEAKHAKVIVKGDHDRVHLHNRHEHNDVTVKGDHDRVKIDDDHHHHDHNKVVVKGDHDRVHVGRRFRSGIRPHPRSEDDVEARSHEEHRHHHHGGKTLVIKGDGKTVNVRRSDDGMDGAPGHVDITSNSADNSAGTRIASLCLSDDFVLNACDTNQTTIYLAPASSSASAASDAPISQILLKMPVYEPDEAAVVPFCATFDPNPSAPEPLTAERCFNSTTPIQDNKSQVFEYDDTTGVVRPMWASSGDDQKAPSSAESMDPPTPEAEGVASVTDIAAGAPTVRRDDSGAQNVTLVFIPDAPIAAKAAGSSSMASSSVLATSSALPTASGGLGAQADETATITATTAAFTSSSVPSSAPAVSKAGVLNVEVGPADSTPTASSWSAEMTSTATANSTSVDATSVAQRIADERRAYYSKRSSEGMATPTAAAPTSSTVASTAVAVASVASSSGSVVNTVVPSVTESAGVAEAPKMTPTSIVDPYRLMFQRETE